MFKGYIELRSERRTYPLNIRYRWRTNAVAGQLAAIRAALEAAGVIFIDENGEGLGVRLRKKRP
jgi:hypothetical protein